MCHTWLPWRSWVPLPTPSPSVRWKQRGPQGWGSRAGGPCPGTLHPAASLPYCLLSTIPARLQPGHCRLTAVVTRVDTRPRGARQLLTGPPWLRQPCGSRPRGTSTCPLPLLPPPPPRSRSTQTGHNWIVRFIAGTPPPPCPGRGVETASPSLRAPSHTGCFGLLTPSTPTQGRGGGRTGLEKTTGHAGGKKPGEMGQQSGYD